MLTKQLDYKIPKLSPGHRLIASSYGWVNNI